MIIETERERKSDDYRILCTKTSKQKAKKIRRREDEAMTTVFFFFRSKSSKVIADE